MTERRRKSKDPYLSLYTKFNSKMDQRFQNNDTPNLIEKNMGTSLELICMEDFLNRTI